jgi:hypothetical protein
MGLNRVLLVGFAVAGLVACGSDNSSGGTGGAAGAGGSGGAAGAAGSSGCVRYAAGDAACSSYSSATWPEAWDCPTQGTATGKLSVSDCASVTFGMGDWPLCCAAN